MTALSSAGVDESISDTDNRRIAAILTLAARLTIILHDDAAGGTREVSGERQRRCDGAAGAQSLATRAEGYRVAAGACADGTGCASLAARLLRRLLEIVRSMMAPQLMHFHA